MNEDTNPTQAGAQPATPPTEPVVASPAPTVVAPATATPASTESAPVVTPASTTVTTGPTVAPSTPATTEKTTAATPATPTPPVAGAPTASVQQPVVPAQPTAPQSPMMSGNMGGGGMPAKTKKMIMMAAIAVIGIAVVGVVSLAVVPKLFSGVSLEKYTSEEQGFSISHPKDWEVESRNEEYLTETTFTEKFDADDKSDGATYSAQIVVEQDKATEDYMKTKESEYFKRYGDALREAEKEGKDDEYPDSEFPTSVELEETEVDGHPALIAEAEVDNFDSSKDEKGKQFIAFIWVSEDLQYTVSLSAHSDDSKYSDKWKSILDSFTVE